MTFGEFRRLSWIKIDPIGYDILAKPSKQVMCDWLRSENIEFDESDDLVAKIKQMNIDKKLYWEFLDIGTETYLDVLASAQNPVDFDDFEVICFDLQNFKVPTIMVLMDSQY